MKAFKFYGVYDVRETEVDIPRVGPEDILVKMGATGICGTDLHVYTDGIWIQQPPASLVTLGHEFSGEVVEVGPSVKFIQKYPGLDAVIRVGDKVVAEPDLTC